MREGRIGERGDGVVRGTAIQRLVFMHQEEGVRALV